MLSRVLQGPRQPGAGRRFACAIAVAALVVSACGESDDKAVTGGGGQSEQFSTVTDGTLTTCADMGYPPVEFYQDGHVAAGSEIEMGQEIAKNLGLKYEVRQVQLNGIVPALLSKRCDFISAGLYPTPERAKTINFVYKSQDGQSLLVRKGNPAGIQGFDDTIAGKRLGMIAGYATIDEVKKKCDEVAQNGAEPCKVVLFSDNAANVSALKAGKVDAVVDSVVAVSYYAHLNENDFEYVDDAELLFKTKVAFGVRKDDPELQAALEDNVERLYKSDYMCKNLAKWGITASALPPYEC
jgi:polar amino acid transport system substrate-binding protein